MTTNITGKDLIDLGFEQGRELGAALERVRVLGLEGQALADWVNANKPAPKLKPQVAPEIQFNLEAETEAEEENVAKVRETMDVLMRTPTLRAGAVMPDACPAGPVGTIPVGGVVAAQNAIHPGMHSADICCSVMVTEFEDAQPKDILDAVHKVTHFGPGGRPNGMRYTMSPELYDAFRENSFLNDKKILQAALEHLGTQGDGNHFAYAGTSSANGTTCLVTHHGSRGPGASLYKLGMRAAEAWRKKLSTGVLKQNAWIPADTDEGEAYWQALQLIRKWTKGNHNCLHQAAAQVAGKDVRERFWNEHNFVFRKGDMFYHAKGATPVDTEMLPDTNGTQIVPLNMAEPVLLIRGAVTDRNLGFAPHGAGRNFSRSAHKRALGERSEAEIFAAETQGIDARFYSGNIDTSELPSAYKPAATVRAQMAKFGLADVVDEIVPYGSIMAGDWERDAPWRKKAAAKRAARQTGGPGDG
ncbi:Protein RtcB [Candidatus Rhodobacter oscarellae]|uniref:3'-phosphate/5'-hydroxy nucleic acid ligase n=1 Tax=Candidatus Rhodobacter oscarellae TaxID=1675527 RepID=A0A0J9E4C9_9RHOB|nr:RtcB family protein [Candidatus Rhodobacter lobularis]KMW57587.1 Protein RtcB [Candidatus Rhodobacter lobularis]